MHRRVRCCSPPATARHLLALICLDWDCHETGPQHSIRPSCPRPAAKSAALPAPCHVLSQRTWHVLSLCWCKGSGDACSGSYKTRVIITSVMAVLCVMAILWPRINHTLFSFKLIYLHVQQCAMIIWAIKVTSIRSFWPGTWLIELMFHPLYSFNCIHTKLVIIMWEPKPWVWQLTNYLQLIEVMRQKSGLSVAAGLRLERG